jgi:hypothetical protein
MIEPNDKVFNHKQGHKSKVKHLIWDNLIMFTNATWDQAVKQVKITSSHLKL